MTPGPEGSLYFFRAAQKNRTTHNSIARNMKGHNMSEMDHRHRAVLLLVSALTNDSVGVADVLAELGVVEDFPAVHATLFQLGGLLRQHLDPDDRERLAERLRVECLDYYAAEDGGSDA